MPLRIPLVVAALVATAASAALGYAPLLALEGALGGRWLVASGCLLAGAVLLASARAWLPAAGLAWTLAIVSFFKARVLPLRFAYNEDQKAAILEFLVALGAGLVVALVLAVIARTRRAPPAAPLPGLGIGWVGPLLLAAFVGAVGPSVQDDRTLHFAVIPLAVLVDLSLIGAGWGRRIPLLAVVLSGAAAAALLAVKTGAFEITSARAGNEMWLVGAAILAGGTLVALIAGVIERLDRPRKTKAPGRGERLIELTWRCSSCGAENLGRHTVCQGCRNAKDGSEKFDLPADSRAVASVTAPELVKLAEAGPHWRCPFCGSDQRAGNGKCRNCGGDPTRTETPEPQRAVSGASRFSVGLLGLAWSLASGLVVGVPARWLSDATVEATVVSARWEAKVVRQRAAILPKEGFEAPAGALEVERVDSRLHHHDTVCARRGTETYSEREQDGTRTEYYSEREECGETCTAGSGRTCREVCTDKGNGFASCKEVCSGRDRVCTPKYCQRRKSREVPKYRTVQKSREVCREYKQEPRFADWLAWKERVFHDEETRTAEGTGHPVRWPELALTANAPDEQRLERSARFFVELRTRMGTRIPFEPESEEAYGKFAAGTVHAIERTESGLVPRRSR